MDTLTPQAPVRSVNTPASAGTGRQRPATAALDVLETRIISASNTLRVIQVLLQEASQALHEATGSTSIDAGHELPIPLDSKGGPRGLTAPPSLNPSRPADLITTAVAVQKYHVSRSTIARALRDGRLTSYRSHRASRTSAHRLQEAEVAAMWPKRELVRL